MNVSFSNRLLAIVIAMVAVAASAHAAGGGVVRRAVRPVPNEWIVVFESNLNHQQVEGLADEVMSGVAGSRGEVLSGALNGFILHGNEQAATALSRNPHVRFVEQVAEIELSASKPYAQWPLDKIDSLNRPPITDGNYTYCSTGAAVPIYIVDTGVRRDHVEFRVSATNWTSRVQTGPNFSRDSFPADDPCGFIANGVNTLLCDDNQTCHHAGHGTSVASVAAGLNWGAAHGATIIPVKVLSCDAQLPPSQPDVSSQVVNGLNWIYNHHGAWYYPMNGVVNMSLFYQLQPIGVPLCLPPSPGMEDYSALEVAVNNLITNRNLTVVASANNQNQDARCTTPANIPAVITVGGTWDNDSKLDASNWGSALDLWAPAANFLTAGILSSTNQRQLEASYGTSFSAALVSGISARYQQNNRWDSSWWVLDDLQARAYRPALDIDPFHSDINIILNYNDCP